MEQFDKGYQFAKAKITAVGFDPLLLGFSDDEEEEGIETEEDPLADP